MSSYLFSKLLFHCALEIFDKIKNNISGAFLPQMQAEMTEMRMHFKE